MKKSYRCSNCTLLFFDNETEIENGLIMCHKCAEQLRKEGYEVSDCCWGEVGVSMPEQSMNPEANIKDPIEFCTTCGKECSPIHINYKENEHFRDTGEKKDIKL